VRPSATAQPATHRARFLVVNNIPTPYRNYQFACLSQACSEVGVDLLVAFQAQAGASHRRRFRVPWRAEELPAGFTQVFSRDILGRARRYHSRWSVNPDLLRLACRGNFDYVMAAPSMSIFNWLFGAMPTPGVKILYSETNSDAFQPHGPLLQAARRRLFAGFDALACPGIRAVELVRSICPQLAGAPVLHWPNVVDATAYERPDGWSSEGRQALRRSLGLRTGTRLLVGVGIAGYKGRDLLLTGLAATPADVVLVLIGEGSNRPLLERHARELGLGARVHFAGLKTEREVAQYLWAADWFVHSSTADPSPLACVEAAFAGLPLALSIQTGNAPELVEPETNGFCFDPTDPSDIARCLTRIAETPRTVAEGMGTHSAKIARARFDGPAIARQFTQDLLGIRKRKRTPCA
jgi:glycosyltransferase involved in cell wall biosynthesis